MHKLPEIEKDRQFNAFIDECYKSFDALQVNNFVYLNRIGKNFKLKEFQEVAGDDIFYNNSNANNFFEPVYRQYEDRNGDTFLWFIGSFLICCLIFFLMLLSRPLKNYIPGIGYF